jgi:hypothetical protein
VSSALEMLFDVAAALVSALVAAALAAALAAIVWLLVSIFVCSYYNLGICLINFSFLLGVIITYLCEAIIIYKTNLLFIVNNNE